MSRIDLDVDYQQTDLYLMNRDRYARDQKKFGKCAECGDWFDDRDRDMVIVHVNNEIRELCHECNEKEEGE
jgi:hypothetical protein